jgi:tryptophanyl-tRNA synthetase
LTDEPNITDSPNNQENLVVDALGAGVVKDYARLIKEFGIEPINSIYDKLDKSKRHYFMDRGIMFGHTGLQTVVDAINRQEKFAVMTGIKPSGKYHIGSITTALEVIYFQQMGGIVSFAIADIESYVASGLSFEKATEISVDNVADLFALGLDTDSEKTFIYRQSEDQVVQKYGHIFSSHVTMNSLRGIYGEKVKLGYYNAALIQVADILRPQIVNGSIPTVTPIGADQAPHGRLTRDIARKQIFQDQFDFTLPSFTYHLMLQGIDGSSKMSKSMPMSVFTLDEDIKSIKKKINNALTGGRDTAQEQRENGAEPDKCRVYDLFKFVFDAEEKQLLERREKCLSGELLCGYCKNDLKGAIEEYQKNHLEKKKQVFELALKVVNSNK